MSAHAAQPDELGTITTALGLELGPAQHQALLRYLDLLQRWNATYNLTAVRERSAMLHQHLADCLAVVRPLAQRLTTGRALDVGSGGGLPGVVLAVALPAIDVTCIDTVAKKAAFIRQVAGTLALPNLHAVHDRVESLNSPPFDLIVCRAFASMARFVAATQHLLAPGGVWLAMKGRHPTDEIVELSAEIEVFHVEPLSVPGLDAERCLVWMRPRTSVAITAPTA
ncbi:MAG: 16S rRNA (guanine(527)-N(7))-methyltransferase RsmG, partial [Burkholderiales bacterium]|nr:16S rRNA (guanine(527)-N(7))-methyltransferase RsmG [Burkholderiales bacterium]